MAPWKHCSCGWWSRTPFCGSCGQELNGQAQPLKGGKGKGTGNKGGTTQKGGGKRAAGPSSQVQKAVDAQVKKTLATMGIVPGKSYAQVAAGKSTTEEKSDVVMAPAATPPSTTNSTWEAMTPQQLKEEHAKRTQLAEGLVSAGMDDAAQEAKARAASLQQLLLKQRPAGQQLDSLGAAVRKATAAREKHEQYMKELEQKQKDAKQKLQGLQEAETAAQSALDELKRNMATSSEKAVETDNLTDISAKFVLALLPQHLSDGVRHTIQAQLNASIAAMQMAVTQAVKDAGETLPPQPRTPSLLQPVEPAETQLDETEPGDFGKVMDHPKGRPCPYQDPKDGWAAA